MNSAHFVHVAELDAVASEIRRVLSDASPHPELQRFAGEYRIAPTAVITVTREGNKLFLQPTGQPKFQLVAESPMVFSLGVVAATVEFETDAAGDVTALTLVQNGHRQRVLRSRP
jgi:hypothetical protein